MKLSEIKPIFQIEISENTSSGLYKYNQGDSLKILNELCAE